MAVWTSRFLFFVPPAGVMKLLLNFFSKKLRVSRGQSPLAPSAEDIARGFLLRGEGGGYVQHLAE